MTCYNRALVYSCNVLMNSPPAVQQTPVHDHEPSGDRYMWAGDCHDWRWSQTWPHWQRWIHQTRHQRSGHCSSWCHKWTPPTEVLCVFPRMECHQDPRAMQKSGSLLEQLPCHMQRSAFSWEHVSDRIKELKTISRLILTHTREKLKWYFYQKLPLTLCQFRRQGTLMYPDVSF